MPTPQETLISLVNSSSMSEPFVNASHSMKQFDDHGFPSILTLFTKTCPPVPSLGLPLKLVERIVVVVFKNKDGGEQQKKMGISAY